MIGLLVLVQAVSPWTVLPATVTVGDTVQLIRRITTTPDVRSRLEPLTARGAVIPLADPRAGYAEGVLVVQYLVAAFEPGVHRVAMPDIELAFGDARTQVLQGDTVRVVVASVLPSDSVTPRQALPVVAITRRRPYPLVAMVLVALGLTVGWGVMRRRPGRGRGQSQAAESHAAPAPVDRWIAAGEGRAVATLIADRMRAVLAGRVPEASRDLDTAACIALLADHDLGVPHNEIAEVLRALERARFAPAVPADVTEVVDRAERVLLGLQEASGVDS